MREIFYVTFLALLPSFSAAASTTLVATGTITYIGALQNGAAVPPPSGVVKVGDAYTVTATFDISKASVGSLYDADPAVNVYSLPSTVVRYNIGSYNRTFAPDFDLNSTVQLWNNREISDYRVDSQSFSFFDYDVKPLSLLPFDIGSGQQSISLSLYSFDYTGNARSNDAISEIAPYNYFSSRSFSLGQLNSDTNMFVSVQGTLDRYTLISVPELATWAMMIGGLGLAGATLRRKGSRATISAA